MTQYMFVLAGRRVGQPGMHRKTSTFMFAYPLPGFAALANVRGISCFASQQGAFDMVTQSDNLLLNRLRMLVVAALSPLI